MNQQIFVCEECFKLFTEQEKAEHSDWGHICKMKKYRKPARCESYIQEYRKVKETR